MKNLKAIALTSLLASTALGGAALAGDLSDPVIDSPIVAPVTYAPVGDWTGFYTGLNLGYTDVDGPGAFDGDGGTYGMHVGYDYDMGDWVVGGELEYDRTDIELGGGPGDMYSIARLKFKAGYDLGSTLVYATAGVARADVVGDYETGPVIGLGMAYRVTDSFTLGAEVLEHRFDNVTGFAGNDVDATAFNLRASFRF